MQSYIPKKKKKKINERLESNVGYTINPYSKIKLGSYELDLAQYEIQEKIKSLKDGESIRIGRSDSNEIIIDNYSGISRNHAIITKLNNQYILTDNNSTNGTRLVGINERLYKNEQKNPLEVSMSFLKENTISIHDTIPDGFIDGGRRSTIYSDGSIDTQREVILVDRKKDKYLTQCISYVKRTAKNMNDREKADFLLDFIYQNAGDEDKVVGKSKKLAEGKKILLGDIFKKGAAVCRHRALMFKILGDEIGLPVEIKRGYLDSMYTGAHTYNFICFEDGTKEIYDAMNPHCTLNYYDNDGNLMN